MTGGPASKLSTSTGASCSLTDSLRSDCSTETRTDCRRDRLPARCGRRGRPDERRLRVLTEGDPAPDFTLTADSGETVALSSLRGKPVVLYFYPKDDTPGCTAQACGIRDAYGEFEQAGAVVLGVSPDDEESHAKFKSKYDLPFTLLADTG